MRKIELERAVYSIMRDHSLPATYRGFSTRKLIHLWEVSKAGQVKDSTLEERVAMQDLLWEYKMAPEFQENPVKPDPYPPGREDSIACGVRETKGQPDQ